MSYEKLIQKDLPYAYYSMDSVGVTRPPLVWAGNGAALITNETLSYNFPVYGSRKQSYAIEVWFKPLSNNLVSIIGHSDGDGLKWYNGYLMYETWIGDQKISVSHYAQKMQTFHIVYLYTENSVALYVNGELSDSHEFSAEEKALPYYEFSEPEKLVTIGSGNPFILDAVAFYSNPYPQLPKNHYQLAQPQTAIIRNAAMRSAETFEVNASNLKGAWVTIDPNDALKQNIASVGAAITQEVDVNGAVLEGKWTALIPSNQAHNHLIEYTSDQSVSIRYSYDGVTFNSVVENYVNTPNQEFFILEFTLSAVFKTTLKDIRIFQYENQTVHSYGGMRQLSITNQSILNSNFYPTIAIDEGLNKSVTITGSEASAAVEFWIKGSSENDITSLNGSKVINNGAGWYSDDWNHVVIGTVPNSFSIGKNDTKIAIINIYAITPDIPNLYLSYFGKNIVSVNDTSLTTITDNFIQYGYVWSVVTA